ncbi:MULTISPECIES: hypothetical protein [unclassified Nostoc]|uniref:hypothetical protein n=1 Tax=unclassified Nostoc TaxID=2593658 RepID=UPI002AD3F5CE|nr:MULTISPECIES: hypothetical protein [unclassified Nostoc]MDZ8035741.1 hypothetical protein [Nostoc sp. DedSLP04]MDZ8130007.1 hypothetical protein [Nostoc sp. DedQUE07]MDZ8139392.1 hypothetical protein [Nostoc sp. DedQUE04]
MSKIISTNAAVVAQEQLFTNLTPEEAAIIEGGYNLYVSSIVCLKDGADSFSQDDVYANVTVDEISSRLDVGGMSAGDGKNLGWEFNFFENAEISFFDSDWPDSDDALGGFSVSGPTNGIQRTTISGGGSRYRVSYSVS